MHLYYSNNGLQSIAVIEKSSGFKAAAQYFKQVGLWES